MFTGLIEEVGKVVKINMGSSSGTIDIQAKKFLIILRLVTVLQ